jgi:TetR/AcrR family transcriptional regulator, repressor for neighboring sulfatase
MAVRTRTSARRRTRRDPQASRDLILAAAEGLFAKQGPDRVGLREVSRAAGVSHGLVSHYFGTYDALVEAALERRIAAIRAQVVTLLIDPDGTSPASPERGPHQGESDRLGAIFLRLSLAAADPITLRLFAWAALTGRLQNTDFFPARVQGLKILADAVENNLPVRGAKKPKRADVEFVVMTTVAMTFGWAIGKTAMLTALGHAESAARDEDFRARLADMLRLYLARPAK